MTSGDIDEIPESYLDAVRELDAILGDLEGDDVDVDTLAAQVRRAGVLLAFCRSRIDTARVEIEQIVAGIDEEPAPAASGAAEEPDEPDWELDEGTLFDEE